MGRADMVQWCLLSLLGPPPNWALLCMVLVIAGAAGGTANYLLIPQLDAENKKPFRSFLFSGIIVSFVVPLFLSVAQSQLIENILRPPPSSNSPETDYFILVGFCIVAAFAARRFMDTMTEQILAQLKKTNENIDATSNMVSQKTDEIKDAIVESGIQHEELNEEQESFTTPPPPALPEINTSEDKNHDATVTTSVIGSGKSTEIQYSYMDLSPHERRVLRAAGKMSARTMTGLAQDSKISSARIGEIVDQLISKGLLRRGISVNTKGLRIMLTAEGARMLDSMSGALAEDNTVTGKHSLP